MSSRDHRTFEAFVSEELNGRVIEILDAGMYGNRHVWIYLKSTNQLMRTSAYDSSGFAPCFTCDFDNFREVSWDELNKYNSYADYCMVRIDEITQHFVHKVGRMLDFNHDDHQRMLLERRLDNAMNELSYYIEEVKECSNSTTQKAH